MKTNLKGFIFTERFTPYLEPHRITEFIRYLQDQNVLYLYPIERKSITEYLNDFIENLED